MKWNPCSLLNKHPCFNMCYSILIMAKESYEIQEPLGFRRADFMTNYFIFFPKIICVKTVIGRVSFSLFCTTKYTFLFNFYSLRVNHQRLQKVNSPTTSWSSQANCKERHNKKGSNWKVKKIEQPIRRQHQKKILEICFVGKS